MIPLKEAIETGAWLQAEYNAHYCDATNKDMVIIIKPRDFFRVDIRNAEITSPFEVLTKDSNLWALKADIVSLFKEELFFDIIRTNILLADDDGYLFNTVYDLALFSSSLGNDIGLDKSGIFSKITPKIPRLHTFVFELPDLFDDWKLTFKNGKVFEA